MANLGSFSVDIRAGTAMLQSDLGRANAILERNAKKMADIGTAAGKAFGTAFVVGITAAAALTKQSIDAADAFQNMSQKVGVGVEALSTLAYAAKQSDLELSKLQSGLIKLTKNASDAAQGVGTAVNGFAALGISVKNADGSLKDSDDLLKEVAESLSQYRDGANKTALAVNIFGKAGADMIPLLNEGAEGIRALEDRARSFGLEISGETAARAEQFNDQLTDIGKLAEGLGNDIAAEHSELAGIRPGQPGKAGDQRCLAGAGCGIPRGW